MRKIKNPHANFDALLGKAAKRGEAIHPFNFFDAEKEICKLCYEEVYSKKTDNKWSWILINKGDHKPHRVRLTHYKHDAKWYCKMSKPNKDRWQ